MIRPTASRTLAGQGALPGTADVATFGAVPAAFLMASPVVAEVRSPVEPAHHDEAVEHGGGGSTGNTSAVPATEHPLAVAGGGMPFASPLVPAGATGQQNSRVGTGEAVHAVPVPPHETLQPFVPASAMHVVSNVAPVATELPHIGQTSAAPAAPIAFSSTPFSSAGDELASVRATAAALHNAITSLTDRLQGGEDGVVGSLSTAPALQAADDQAAGVIDQLAGLHAAIDQQVLQAEHAVTGIADGATTDAQALTAPLLHAADTTAAHLIDQTHAATDAAGAAFAGIVDQADGAVEHLAAAGSLATETAGHAVSDIDGLASVTGALPLGQATVLPAAADLATGNIAQTVALATDAGTKLVEPTGVAVDHAALTVGHAADLAGGQTDHDAAPIVSSIFAETDHLDGMHGSDPAAGVATLVGMVASADHFGLQQEAAADHVVATDGGLGGSDLLAEVAPASALLGTADHHDGALSNVTDHFHDGLFGHG